MGQRGIFAYFCRLRDCRGCGIEVFWPCGRPCPQGGGVDAPCCQVGAASPAAGGLPVRNLKQAWEAAVGLCRRGAADAAVTEAACPRSEPGSEPSFRVCHQSLPRGVWTALELVWAVMPAWRRCLWLGQHEARQGAQTMPHRGLSAGIRPAGLAMRGNICTVALLQDALPAAPARLLSAPSRLFRSGTSETASLPVMTGG